MEKVGEIKKNKKVTFFRTGKNRKYLSSKISIPISWLKEIYITADDPYYNFKITNNKIIISKHYKEDNNVNKISFNISGRGNVCSWITINPKILEKIGVNECNCYIDSELTDTSIIITKHI